MALAFALVAAGAVAAAPAGGQGPVSVPFTELGTHSFPVPAGICQVRVDVRGAQGGGTIGVGSAGLEAKLKAGSSGSPSPDEQAKFHAFEQRVGAQGTGIGGLGGDASATLPVTPGEVLTITVGEQGGDFGPPGLNAGAPDGGNGGAGEGTGAGGGGSSDVRQGGTDLAHRVVVAGGGGGAGFGFIETDDLFQDGGGGGGATGQAGDPPAANLGAGQGGTPSAGGVGGNGFPIGPSGSDGALGTGGDGASNFVGGAGGGGGYYGGGGGSAVALLGLAAFGDAGGGGSGFGPAGTVFQTGMNTGNGSVTVTYDPDVSGCAVIVGGTPHLTG